MKVMIQTEYVEIRDVGPLSRLIFPWALDVVWNIDTFAKRGRDKRLEAF